MANNLQKIQDLRLRFRAEVKGFSSKKNPHTGMREKTLLLQNIIRLDNQELVANSLTFVIGSTIAKLNLKIGDMIEFNARSGKYVQQAYSKKGLIDKYFTSYKLKRPTQISKVVYERG